MNKRKEMWTSCKGVKNKANLFYKLNFMVDVKYNSKDQK